MGIQQCILIACIDYFRLTSAESHNQIINQFQNLFDSIGKSDAKNSEIYHDILKQEVAREQQVFHATKEELHTARKRNLNKKIIFKNQENIIAAKREIGVPTDLRRAKKLALDYTKHYGTNYSNPEGEWKLARNCTGGYNSEVNCRVPKQRNMLCEICEKAGKKHPKLSPHAPTLTKAKFFQGNLTFPGTDYKHEMRIDIIKCNFDVHTEEYFDLETFLVTRGKQEKSAYFLDSFYTFNEEVHYGYKYSLRHPYVVWD